MTTRINLPEYKPFEDYPKCSTWEPAALSAHLTTLFCYAPGNATRGYAFVTFESDVEYTNARLPTDARVILQGYVDEAGCQSFATNPTDLASDAGHVNLAELAIHLSALALLNKDQALLEDPSSDVIVNQSIIDLAKG